MTGSCQLGSRAAFKAARAYHKEGHVNSIRARLSAAQELLMQFPLLAFQMRRVRWTFENAKGFGCRPMTDGAADTEAWGRGPKASKEGNRGKWHAVVLRALWGCERGRRGA